MNNSLSKLSTKPALNQTYISYVEKFLHVRYLGTKIDENLNWKTHVHDLASKLKSQNTLKN